MIKISPVNRRGNPNVTIIPESDVFRLIMRSKQDVRGFESEEFGQVRVVVGPDGEPWFVASDVARVLGYKNTRDAIAKHCKYSSSVAKRDGGFLTIIPESDIYRLIMRSKMPQAEEVQVWVSSDILPTIRKHGAMNRLLKRVSLMTTPFLRLK